MKTFAILILALLASCAHAPAHKIVFAQLPPPASGTEEVWLTGGASGYLVIDNGCLRIRSAETGALHTPYWHSAFELVTNNRGVGVHSKVTGKTYLIGTFVRVGGGAMDSATARNIDPVAAQQCGEPFASTWISE